MRNYDITQTLWHETGKMSPLNISQNDKKNKSNGNGKCHSRVTSMKVCLTLTNVRAIHERSCYGYHEKIRYF